MSDCLSLPTARETKRSTRWSTSSIVLWRKLEFSLSFVVNYDTRTTQLQITSQLRLLSKEFLLKKIFYRQTTAKQFVCKTLRLCTLLRALLFLPLFKKIKSDKLRLLRRTIAIQFSSLSTNKFGFLSSDVIEDSAALESLGPSGVDYQESEM